MVVEIKLDAGRRTESFRLETDAVAGEFMWALYRKYDGTGTLGKEAEGACGTEGECLVHASRFVADAVLGSQCSSRSVVCLPV